MSLILRILLGLPALGVLFVVLKTVRHWFRQAHLRDIPGPPPASLISGNLKQLFSLDSFGFHATLLETYGRLVRIRGLFGDTQLYVSDPKALYHILIKDQYIYDETDQFVCLCDLIFGAGLLSTRGEHHRRQRKLLNPVFSTKHMRYIVPTFYRISHQLCDIWRSKLADGPRELDVLDWMNRVALELIGQGGLGYSFQALDETASNRFCSAMKSFTPTVASLQLLRQTLPWIYPLSTSSSYPPLFSRLTRYLLRQLPIKRLQKLFELSDIMNETAKEIWREKKVKLDMGEEEIMCQVGEGRDIMSILMKANMEASEEDRLPESELTAQMSTLIFAAMDTTSNAMSRIIHVLAENQDAQDRLREELVNARKKDSEDGDLDYDAVCRETLRLHPPILQMFRTTRKDVLLPLGSAISLTGTGTSNDKNLASELFIPSDTILILAIQSINTDTTIWGPDAKEWKPERWLSEHGGLPESVVNAGIPGVYSNMMTFLGGARACIGFKFAQFEMKIVLSLLLSSFRFSSSPSSSESTPNPSTKSEESKPRAGRKYKFRSSNIVTPTSVVDGRPGMVMQVSLV